MGVIARHEAISQDVRPIKCGTVNAAEALIRLAALLLRGASCLAMTPTFWNLISPP